MLDTDIREEFEGVAVIQHRDNEIAGCLTADKAVSPSRGGGFALL